MSDWKETSIGTLPSNWEVVELNRLTYQIVDGTHFTPTYVDSGIPFLRVTDIQNGRIDLDSVKRIPEKEHQQLTTRCNPVKGDLLVSKNGTVGIPKVVDWDWPFSIFVSLCLVKLRPELLVKFLRQLLESSVIEKQIHRRSKQGTLTNLHLEEIREFEIPLPPLPEQRKIASILTTVDSLIEKTEALIEKYRQVKQGMMADLLSRGVDSSGKLRPTQQQAPELYKQSDLGWIPKEWEVDHLTNRVTFPQGQVDPRVAPYRDWFLLAPDHIEQRTGRVIQYSTAAQQNAISGKYIFEGGDVVYSKIRPYLRKAMLAENRGICSADMYPLRPVDNLRSRYLLTVVLGEEFSRFAESVSERSGFPKINRSELREFRTGFPPATEQDAICRAVESSEDRLSKERKLLGKLRSLKTGLMQDLLTGKVRVNVDEVEEALANA